MRVAVLAASGLFAARLEEYAEAHSGSGIRIVWAVMAPGSVLAALDHDPEVFLLDMRWGMHAVTAGKLLREAGVPLVICLFDRMDDPLTPVALAAGLEAFHWMAPLNGLLERLGSAG